MEHYLRSVLRAIETERALAERARALAASFAEEQLANRFHAIADDLDRHADSMVPILERLRARAAGRAARHRHHSAV